jgi:hypothetical protein
MHKKSVSTFLAIVFVLLALAQPVAADWSGGDASGNGITPVYRTDLLKNNECETLGYDFGFKVPGAPDGTYPFDLSNGGELLGGAPSDGGNSVTLYGSDGKTFSWSSTLGIDAVVVKAGTGANVYEYSPESTGDTNLHSPYSGTGAGDTGTIRDVSHVTFCYDYEVDVSKTASTSFTRTYEWDITKGPDGEYWMFAGDKAAHGYSVAVDKTGYTDSDWAVAGTITVENNTPFDAEIASVGDVVSGFGSVSVTCDQGVPGTLLAGQAMNCTYSTGLPDGSPRTNTATVTTTGIVGGSEGTADVIFGAPTTEVDKEVNVTDTNGQSWGPVSDDATWNYGKEFTCSSDPADYINGSYSYSHVNTATIDETGQSDDATVVVQCYAPVVSKDAQTSYTRTWNWTIDKTADQTDLVLSAGQQFPVNYQVKVETTFTDSDWAAAGTISVQNPNPKAAMTVSLADAVEGIPATLDCGGSLTVPASGSATCGYTVDLLDGTDRTNTATATLNGITFVATADVVFGNPSTVVDECIDVSDDKAGFLGTACASTSPTTFSYQMLVGPYDTCGLYQFVNTASFVTNDTGTTGSDDWTVNVDVPCGGGCTLTQGYWKTHSEYGPAPYDETWALLSNGADTPFFDTGYSYYEILWMAPKGGNPYLILAHQYIAAELNVLNEASIPAEVLDAWNQATELLDAYEDGLSIPKKKADGVLAIELAELLDDYNNGLVGPGHCSE